MRSVTSIILFGFTFQTYTEELIANDIARAPGFANMLVEGLAHRLFEGLLAAWPLRHASLEKAVVRPVNLGHPGIPYIHRRIPIVRALKFEKVLTSPNITLAFDEEGADKQVPTPSRAVVQVMEGIVRQVAEPVAPEHDLQIKKILFQGITVQIVVRSANETEDTGLTAVAAFAKQINRLLDAEEDNIPYDRYTLEVTTPGISEIITDDRAFITWKTYPVIVKTSEIFKKRQQFEGTLQGRDDKFVKVSLKGRPLSIPREICVDVRLARKAIEG